MKKISTFIFLYIFLLASAGCEKKGDSVIFRFNGATVSLTADQSRVLIVNLIKYLESANFDSIHGPSDVFEDDNLPSIPMRWPVELAKRDFFLINFGTPRRIRNIRDELVIDGVEQAIISIHTEVDPYHRHRSFGAELLKTKTSVIALSMSAGEIMLHIQCLDGIREYLLPHLSGRTQEECLTAILETHR